MVREPRSGGAPSFEAPCRPASLRGRDAVLALGRWTLALAGLLVLATGPLAAQARGPGSNGADSARARAGPPTGRQERTTYLADPRLAADSTLFPYEWPALDRLRVSLADLRPALEAASVVELAGALPEIRARVDSLLADSIPALLAARREDVEARKADLQRALGRAGELASAALAEPPDTLGGGGGFPVLGGSGSGQDSLAQPAVAESRGLPPALPAPLPGAPPADSAASADSVAPADSVRPRSSFLEAWREVYAAEEAFLHLIRDPFGS